MSKSNFFTGQPILNQVLKFIDRNEVNRISSRHRSDRYYKSFTTHTHLLTMLYCMFSKCQSSREVVSGMKACQHKLQHIGVSKAPGKSTLCDANKKRNAKIFEDIYQSILNANSHLLPDSRTRSQKLYIADSSTISLFQEILKGNSMGKMNGKRKGGIKVHTLLDASNDIPVHVNLTPASDNDMPFLRQIKLPTGSFLTFDKGYVDYGQYQRFSNEQVYFVTRNRKGSFYTINGEEKLSETSIAKGVLSDKTITLGTRTHAKGIKLKARLVEFIDREKNRTFEFLTNNFDLAPELIAQIYQKRWQIELLFKRLKQNFPLKYFLGDNENAIKIQVWCALIADLLIKLIHHKLKRKWAFSSLTSIIRLHLMSYLKLKEFLNNPDKIPATNQTQLRIRGSGF